MPCCRLSCVQAFDRLFTFLNTTKEVLFADRPRIRAIVSYHILPVVVTTAQLFNGQVLPTLNPDANISVAKTRAGAITLFNAACPACPKARVIKANIPNIVPDAAAKRDFTIIHMIDTVLLPSL
ncbi:hypothetical protein MNEG_2445 [Monoraphidium neglectum]|uniref:FAS1 domain-containing protein n=1 Tax=Monoraphidium neglectum TaxID=145388 RepID=A0A0D2NL93_9CHLO|nr:hypothetical protein MNEG_2445 [Monoraphidium neglectum]KIZ05511.1 hypothetical protein MNEG_2445 [Monoraphidium neglectum]|eukprot:XP_013904530.1 hypothetical protein MNEG_2445 [Monoraphidium neglectum]